MLTLHKLEIFATVVDAGSFSAAAERLLMTQSAVSQHIQDLEASLGTRLFNRGRRGVTLTTAGATLDDYTRQILRLVVEAESAVTDVENLSGGQVSIGATPGVSVYLLPEWMQAFRVRCRHLTAAMETAVTPEVIAGVLQHRLDIGFIEGELDAGESPHLGQMVLETIDLFVILGQGHAWWDAPAVTIDQLNGQPLVTRQPRARTRVWLDTLLREHGVQADIVAELDNPESIKRVVMSGMGISIMPGYAVQHEVAAGTLRALPVQDVALERTLKLVWDRQVPFAPIPRAFLTHLSVQFPQLLTLLP
jgi:DNA-binding transcriptional LysR family regulator